MLELQPIEIWLVALENLSDDGLGDGADEGSLYSDAQIEDWSAMLSREEQLRANAFRGEGHRREYVVAHIALRTVLGELLGILPAEVEFAEGSFGSNGTHGKAVGRSKPALRINEAAEGTELDLRFNLSHTRGAALIGVAEGRELGVDIERERPMEDLEAIARSVMSSEEWQGWLAIPKQDQMRAFYCLWTRKEAYLKAIGLGLFRSLQGVTVPVTAEALDEGRIHRVWDLAGAGAWQVLDVEAGPGFAAAVSVEGTDVVRLIVRELNLGGSETRGGFGV